MKTKKLISVILAVLMLTTSFSSALTAFASSDSVEAAGNLISGFSADMTDVNVSAADLEAYNNMVSAYNALSQEEKDEFDVFLFSKLLLAVYDREMALWKQENNSTSTANAYKAVHARAEAVITMPSYVAQAVALYTEADAIKTRANAESFIANLKAASLNAIILAGGYYKSYKAFRYGANEKYGVELIDLAADKISSITQSEDSANKPSSPKSVSKPSVSKFESEDDPAYIEAYQKYLDYKEAQADYNVKRYEFEFEKHYLAALKSLTDAVPYFTFVYEVSLNSIAAKRNFNENSDTAKIAEVLAVYNTLTDAQKVWFESIDGYAFAEKVAGTENSIGIEYKYNSLKVVDLIEFCTSMEFFYTIKNFEDAVNETEQPYTNADIAKVKAAYSEIPESILASVSEEVLAKYKEILAAVGPDEASDAQPDLGVYTETEVSFDDISEKNAAALADSLGKLILNATGTSDFKSFIDSNVFTNKTVMALAGWLYDLLAEETDGLIDVSPSAMSAQLTEEKFAGAVEALNAAGEDWAAVTAESGDLGFEDGDVEGFLDATCAMLRGASLLHVALTLENTADTKNGTYNYGAYEELIEILEILDLKSVKSSADYTEYVNNAENKNDAKFRAILAPIAYLIADFGNDPINTICDVLPKVAYAVESGIINTRINSFLDKIQIIEIDPVDLTTAGIYDILDEELLAENNIAVEEEFTALIKALAGCGKAVSKPSVQRGQSYRMGIESDKAKVMAVLLDCALDTLGSNEAIAGLIIEAVAGENAFLGSVLSFVINAVTNVLPRKISYFVISSVVTIVNVVLNITAKF